MDKFSEEIIEEIEKLPPYTNEVKDGIEDFLRYMQAKTVQGLEPLRALPRHLKTPMVLRQIEYFEWRAGTMKWLRHINAIRNTKD